MLVFVCVLLLLLLLLPLCCVLVHDFCALCVCCVLLCAVDVVCGTACPPKVYGKKIGAELEVFKCFFLSPCDSGAGVLGRGRG